MKNIVILGGGSGTFTLLSGLRQYPTNNTVVISTADDGGSTGTLRKELGVMPYGDVRQCLIGLSYTTPTLEKLFNYRFDEGSLKGHALGNILLAALEKITGSANESIAEASRLLNVRGEVLFSSLGPTTLSAEYEDGSKKTSEHEIDEPTLHKAGKITDLTLSGSKANPEAIQAIKDAHAIIFGPGDLYTSTLPNILVKGIGQAIASSKAKKILITNLMTKYGQTDGFVASDFLRVMNEYLAEHSAGAKIDTIIVNSDKPSAELLSAYKKEKAAFVTPDMDDLKKTGVEIIEKPLFSTQIYKKQNGDTLKRSYIRHDSKKTAETIWSLLN